MNCYWLLALILLPGFVTAADTEQPLREWESFTGTKMEARLIDGLGETSVTLEKADGSTLEVRVDQLSASDQQYLEELAAAASRPKKVLFIGNSYTGQIRKTFTNFVKASPYKDCKFEFVTPGGKTLAGHLANAETMQKIKEGTWDIVVLQDQSQTPAVFPQKFKDAAEEIDRMIDETGARTMFYETWGRRDGDKLNAQRFPTYEKMQDALSESYAKVARSCDAELVRVGQAWSILRESDPALGRELYARDGSHPAAPGAFLASCVFYATFFGADPVEVDFDGGLSKDQVAAIHKAVAEAMGDR